MLTFGQVGEAKAAGGTPFPESTWTYSYNDQPLAEVEVPIEGDPKHPRFLELLALILAFAQYEHNLKIEDRIDGIPGEQESPDFFVTFDNGQHAAVEVARLTDEERTRWDSLVRKIDANLKEAFTTDSNLAARFERVSLSIRLAIHDAKGFNDKTLTAAIIEKLMRVPEGRILPMGIVTPGPADELLNKHKFHLMFSPRHYKWTEVSPYLPNGGVDQEQDLIDLINKKNRPTYDTKGLPLWLVLAIADPFGQLTYELESFAERAYAIGKFEHMIITNGFAAVRTKPGRAA
jgi:hypothetical protein